MQTLEVVVYPDPILRRGGAAVTQFDASLRELAARMFEAMYAEGGVGLAAPQVAVAQKLLVLNPSGDRNDRTGELVLLNPKITRKKGRAFGEEGCLSFPGIYYDVKRRLNTVARGFTDRGDPVQVVGTEWLARCLQHETDHLDGVLFIDRMDQATRKQAMKAIREANWNGPVKISPHRMSDRIF